MHIKLVMHHLCVFVCARGTQSRVLACTFIMRECALLSTGLSIINEETYTVQL